MLVFGCAGLRCCASFSLVSLVAAAGDYSLVVVHRGCSLGAEQRLLFAVAFLVAGYRL